MLSEIWERGEDTNDYVLICPIGYDLTSGHFPMFLIDRLESDFGEISVIYKDVSKPYIERRERC